MFSSSSSFRRVRTIPKCAPWLLCGACLWAGAAQAQVKLDTERGGDGVKVRIGGQEGSTPALVRPSKALSQEARASQPLISNAFAPGDVRGEFLGQMRRGELTPEAAWDKGLLTKGNVFKIAGPWRDWSEEGKMLRLHLVALLAERAPDVLSPDSVPSANASEIVVLSNEESGEKSGERARAEGLEAWSGWKSMVAQHYRFQQDDRAVAWYEAALVDWQKAREAKAKTRAIAVETAKQGEVKRDVYGMINHDDDAIGVIALAGLARYYAETGEPRKGAQTWERAKNYSKNPLWLVDALLEGARAYTQAGDAENAKANYAQMSQHGYGWHMGLAIYDQASALIVQGNHQEARALLLQPLTGARSVEIKVALLTLLSESYLRTGEVGMARQTARGALNLYTSLPRASRSEAYMSQVQYARDIAQSQQLGTKQEGVPD